MDKATKALADKINKLEKTVHELRNAPRQQDEETETSNDGTREEQEEMERGATILPHRNPANVNAKYAKSKWYNSLERWKVHPFRWWKDRVEIIALIAGVSYAVVTYFQWRDLRHNFTIDERAWIWVKSKKDNPSVADIAQAGITLEAVNIGKTPARNVKITTLRFVKS